MKEPPSHLHPFQLQRSSSVPLGPEVPGDAGQRLQGAGEPGQPAVPLRGPEPGQLRHLGPLPVEQRLGQLVVQLVGGADERAAVPHRVHGEGSGVELIAYLERERSRGHWTTGIQIGAPRCCSGKKTYKNKLSYVEGGGWL